jgi:hypothetical protein
MARYSSRTDVTKIKTKQFTGNTKKAMDFAWEYVVPKTPADVALTILPYGKVAKGAVKAAKAIKAAKTVKKVIKPASKVKKITSKKIK